jgi:ATP/maltotriose-dependent transcriptional regulator MalT
MDTVTKQAGDAWVGEREYLVLARVLVAVQTHAAPEGYLRVFIDEGSLMAGLVRDLLVGRRQEQAFEEPDLDVLPPVRRDAAVQRGLVAPLTARELEVLELLAAGEPNRGIANKLFVTVDTIKRHVSHILDKLGAANRTQAVTRARELDLLA